MPERYLYTIPDCEGCQRARELLAQHGLTYREVVIDNPIVEIGVKVLLQRNEIRAPLLFVPGEALYTYSWKAEYWEILLGLEGTQVSLVQ